MYKTNDKLRCWVEPGRRGMVQLTNEINFGTIIGALTSNCEMIFPGGHTEIFLFDPDKTFQLLHIDAFE
jgi:hypothetical protein